MNDAGVTWTRWLSRAGYTSDSIRNVTDFRLRELRAAWRSCEVPEQHGPNFTARMVRVCKDVATKED